MIKTKNKILLAAAVCFALVFGACVNEEDTTEFLAGGANKVKKVQPESSGVDITPSVAQLYATQTQAFTAKLSVNSDDSEGGGGNAGENPESSVEGGGAVEDTFKWSIIQKSSDETVVSEDGLVTLGAGEKGPYVVVKVVSDRDAELWATAVITVKSGSAPKPTAVYTVTFDINGGTSGEILPVQVTEGDSAASVLGENWQDPENKTDLGFGGGTYYLESWNTAADASGKAWAVSDPVMSDLTVYAIWGILPADRSALYFDTMGETVKEAPATLQVLTGQSVSTSTGNLTIPVVESSVSDFVGWFQNRIGLNVPFTADTVIYDKEMTVYAKWTTKTYLVSFQTNGGEPLDSYRVDNGTHLTLKIPQKNSSIFDGWYANPEFTGEAWTHSNAVTKDTILYAKWTDVKTHTVTFDTKSGTPVPDAQNIIDGTKVHYPPDPALSGYKFGAWYKGGVEWNFNDAVSEDMDLEAQWISNSANTRTVTYNSNGGTPVASRTIEVGGLLKTPQEPTKSSALFAGWYKSDSTPWNFASDRVSENITLTAHWTDIITYTVTFNSHGGTSVNTASVGENTLVNMPASPTKSGATFAGWYKESNYANPWQFLLDRVDSNTELHAKWTHTVSFEVNGGNRIDPIPGVGSGERIAPFTNPARSGATFDSWYKEEQLTNKWVFSTDTVTNDITLYAGWSHTLTFNSKGGNPANTVKTVKSGGTTTAPTVTKENATFEAWCTDATLKVEWNAGTPVINDSTIYARWHELNLVTFNSNGAQSVDSQSVYTGSKLTEPSEITFGTARFAGWYQKADFSGEKWDFQKSTVSTGMTLYAKWTYTVQFYDGSTMISDTEAAKDKLLPSPASPAKTGFTFVAWTKSNGGNDKWDFGKDIITGALTLYAKWNANVYKVKFDTGDGSITADQNIAHGQKVTKPTDPTQTGYTFGGWYSDTGLKNVFSFTGNESNETITGNKTLYAKWNISEYSVSFDTKVDGLSVVSQTVKYNNYAAQPTVSNPGNGLLGWFTAEDYTTKWVFDRDKVTKNLTLYAKWNPNGYVVTFNTGGSSTEIHNQIVSSGKYAERPRINPVKDGVSFDDWYKESTTTANTAGNTLWNFETDAITSDTTIYAKYSTNTHKVTFHANYENATYNKTVTVSHGAAVAAPAEAEKPTRTGYKFNGWYKDYDCQEMWHFTNDKVTSNTIIWAGWTANKYNVYFDPGTDGSVYPASVYQEYGTEVALPQGSNITRFGYTFTGWYPASNSPENQRYLTFTVPANSVTIYAHWKLNEYTVYFDGGDGVQVAPGYKTDISGTEITIPTVSKTGYTLDGWYLHGNFTGDKYSGTYRIGNSTVTLHAKWVINEYTVSFNTMSGAFNSGVSNTFRGSYNSTVPLPTDSQITRSGYEFIGWSETEGGAIKVQNYKVKAENTTLYAIWAAADFPGWINNDADNTITREFAYTGASQSFTVSVAGTYVFEAWGAAGANPDGAANKGGYSSGVISNIPEGTEILVYVGGEGSPYSGQTGGAGGWNGGGAGGTGAKENHKGGSGGGGATDFRFTSVLNTRILVAGGGGGNSGLSELNETVKGGVGGGSSGGNGEKVGAEGGTQTEGNAFGVGAKGSNGRDLPYSAEGSGGGGGGYYGGKTLEITGSQGNQSSGSGGGSGFVYGYTATQGSSTTGDILPNIYQSYTFSEGSSIAGGGSSGNGYAKVTYRKE